MPAQDTSEVKEKIVSIFKRRGPSLPVHVSQETGLSILFASVFLSELLSEKKLGISNMKVGNTPIYFIPGQEPMLERFSEHLKSKEKESFNLLKEKTFLKDSEQEPAIRVALRSLKDFAVPFKKNDEFYWKYFIVSKEELKNFLEERKTEIKSESSKKIIEEKPKKIKKKTGKKPKRTLNLKQSEKFLDKIKNFLGKSFIEISSIESMGKNELTLKVKENGKEKLLIAYNKKRITEKEIINASKKASELDLNYSIISLGKLPKKMSDFMDSLRNLDEVKRMDV